MSNRYTDEEIEFLKENYSNTKNEELAESMDRSENSIGIKASRMNLEKSEAFIRKTNSTNTQATLELEFDDYRRYIGDYCVSKNGHFIAGLTVAEGSFHYTNVETLDEPRFAFSLGMSSKDEDLIQFLCCFFDSGNDEPYKFETNPKNWQDKREFKVGSEKDLLEEIIPVMDKTLDRNCLKWKKYVKWRDKLLQKYGIEM